MAVQPPGGVVIAGELQPIASAIDPISDTRPGTASVGTVPEHNDVPRLEAGGVAGLPDRLQGLLAERAATNQREPDAFRQPLSPLAGGIEDQRGGALLGRKLRKIPRDQGILRPSAYAYRVTRSPRRPTRPLSSAKVVSVGSAC